jgi:hypothetical protein
VQSPRKSILKLQLKYRNWNSDLPSLYIQIKKQNTIHESTHLRRLGQVFGLLSFEMSLIYEKKQKWKCTSVLSTHILKILSLPFRICHWLYIYIYIYCRDESIDSYTTHCFNSSRGLLGCEDAYCCGRKPTFQRSMLPPSKHGDNMAEVPKPRRPRLESSLL